MNEAIAQMLSRYETADAQGRVRALREILQALALLGLWRSKFFDKAAFYGGTALRLLYGLDRFSEDLDFSLVKPTPDFDLARYGSALENEIAAFGFRFHMERKEKTADSAVQSAFLKADTVEQLLVIETTQDLLRQIPRGQVLRIRLEVDTNPPGGFQTETKFLLQPIPFAVRTYVLPDLFAGKMHALLCRRWKNRVKGRDWYDLVWYAANHPELHLAHLERRMVQSGHWPAGKPLTPEDFQALCANVIDSLDVDLARKDVALFIRSSQALDVWSREFFHDLIRRIRIS